jgi:hypothetical protein
MKRFLQLLAAVVLVPIFAALFLGGPAEILVSSWNMWRASAVTEGTLLSSKVVRASKGGSQSKVTYSFEVDGRKLTGSRVTAGFFSERTKGAHGGDFAATHRAGSKVKVYYDPKDPTFAMLDFGWPGFGAGWTLFVLGLVIGGSLSVRDLHSRTETVRYAFFRAIALTGFVTFGWKATITPPHGLLELAVLYACTVVIVLIYANVKFKPPAMHIPSWVK